jgi:hypothetical protein
MHLTRLNGPMRNSIRHVLMGLWEIALAIFKRDNEEWDLADLCAPKKICPRTISWSHRVYFGPRPRLVTAPPDDDARHEYEVDRIMGYRKRNDTEYYYIHWKGYPAEDDTWEPKENISEAALKAWERQNQEKTKPRKGRGPKRSTDRTS